MGRGGASGLWSSDVDQQRSGGRTVTEHGGATGRCWEEVSVGLIGANTCVCAAVVCSAECYEVKPHGQLVSVSLRHYCPSTPDLSTWWSATTLLGGQASGRSHLQACFPLRCFQRLSLPHIATRQCDWRHNRYTSGASTPVLSY